MTTLTDDLEQARRDRQHAFEEAVINLRGAINCPYRIAFIHEYMDCLNEAWANYQEAERLAKNAGRR